MFRLKELYFYYHFDKFFFLKIKLVHSIFHNLLDLECLKLFGMSVKVKSIVKKKINNGTD